MELKMLKLFGFTDGVTALHFCCDDASGMVMQVEQQPESGQVTAKPQLQVRQDKGGQI